MRKKVFIVGCLLAVAVVAFWFFQPAPSYNIARVDPRLCALKQPYQSVRTEYYWDGGSVGIEIIDCDGKMEQFAIPAHLGEPNPYTKVYVGAMHDRKPGAVEIAEPEQTKRMLIRILSDCPNRTKWDDVSLMQLARRPVDIVGCWIHRWRGDFEPGGAMYRHLGTPSDNSGK